MNTPQALRSPIAGLLIVAFVLLAAFVVSTLMPFAWSLISDLGAPVPIQTYPLDVVSAFHSEMKSSNVDAILALFADDATVTDNASVIQGREQIRDWVLHSQRMVGLHLSMMKSETDGDKVVWLDTAYNGPELENKFYILRWEALILDSKIQTLTVTPWYAPDLK